MRPLRLGLLGLSTLILVAAAACGGTGGDDDSGGSTPAATGTIGGPCYGNGTCNTGLSCLGGTCIAGSGMGGSGTAGTGTAGTGTAGSGTAGSGAFGNSAGSGTGGGCATAVFVGKQAPAAMLLVMDRSASMTSKWPAAKGAVVKAIDTDIFNTMSLGLLLAPSSTITGPACIFNFPVECGAPTSPQVGLADAGTKKSSDPSSVRGIISGTMGATPPSPASLGDASPLYAAIDAGLGALKAWPKEGKRILLVVTDGTLSCNETSSRPGFPDANGCSKDWEDPNNIVKLVADANGGAPGIETFVVGVPGADTYDPSGANFPPYHMRAALSAIAYAGSPKYVDPTCTGKSFTQQTADPAKSCHFDMTTGGFGADQLAAVIGKVRQKTLGCVFDVPVPEDGTPINPDQVNVEANFGMGIQTVYKGDASDPKCDGQYYCWQYTPDMSHIELVGKACNDLQAAGLPTVSIVVGCDSQIVPK